MKKKTKYRYEKLIKEFGYLSKAEAKELDEKIINYIQIYKNGQFKSDVSNFIQDEVEKYTKRKRTEKSKKKCNSIAGKFIDSEEKWNIQEAWFNVLAYLITIILMIVAIIIKISSKDALINFGLYLIALCIWVFLNNSDRETSERTKNLLYNFVRDSGSLLFISSLLFYLCILYSGCRHIIIIIPLLTIISIIYLIHRRYKQQEELKKQIKEK